MTNATPPAAPVQRPATLDALVAIIQREFPTAGIRITDRARTIRQQAERMVTAIRGNRTAFLGTYRAAPHITEMTQWVDANPHATQAQTVDQFEGIINRARARGAVVSDHLSDTALDISIPIGSAEVQGQIEARITQLGARVLREPSAGGGPHWHLDW